MKLLVSLLLLISVSLFAADKRVFTDAGPCPKCGAVLHNVSPVNVDILSVNSNPVLTTVVDKLFFKCKSDGTVFWIPSPPRHLQPPITTEKITPRPEKKVALGRVTHLPPPIVWDISITNGLSMALATNLLYPKTWKMKLR